MNNKMNSRRLYTLNGKESMSHTQCHQIALEGEPLCSRNGERECCDQAERPISTG